ncbi:serine/threonine-protein phosphatase 2A activator [Microdochium nivale]|nr:serine/threonine-protein phosphatase 2A activator [Microdochium nivale]
MAARLDPALARPGPKLGLLDLSAPFTFVTPTKCINDGPDVTRFLVSKAYRDIGLFLMQLNRAMCPRKSIGPDGKETFTTYQIGSDLETKPAASVRRLQEMLAKIDSFIDEAPPDQGPRRFGNVSFRKWFALLEEHVPALLQQLLPEHLHNYGTSEISGRPPATTELSAYLLGGFGSAQRLDYGTGHELNFFAFLGGLWKLGYFQDGEQNGDVERSIVLGVIEPYLRVVRRLILTYTLEPAGSHGVWGLDDHSFLPYIFGSAQLTRPITEDEPMPLEGSLFRATKPSFIVKPEFVEEERKRNMYFSAVGFINDVKKGPFWEHSPILFDVSGIKDGWGKINKGMVKMFNAEVLSKFPVVQHFHFGSLFSWEVDPDAPPAQQSIHMANQPPTQGSMTGGAGMAAPWAKGGGTIMPPPPPPSGRAAWGPSHPAPRPQAPAPTSRAEPRGMPSSSNAPWMRSSDRPSG